MPIDLYRLPSRRLATRTLCLWLGLSLSLLSQISAADNRIEVRSGDRITGDLRAGEEDALVFTAPRGSLLSFTVAGAGGLVPVLDLMGPGGALEVEALASGSGSSRRSLKRLVLPRSGTWILRVRSAGVAEHYELALRIDAPRSTTGAIALDGDGDGQWVIERVPAGARTRLRLRADAGEGPKLLAIRDERGRAIEIEALRESARTLQFEVPPAAEVRDLALWLEAPGAAEISARCRLTPERRVARDLSLVGDPAQPVRARARTHPNEGFESWLQLERVSVLEPGKRTLQFSSFDRTGANDDGFSGAATSWLDFRFDPTSPSGYEVIVLDLAGAGVLNRMHWAFLSSGPPPFFDPFADRYDLRFYFDGDATPTFVVPLREFVAGTSPAWPYPLAAEEFAAVGGPYNNTPLPFRTGLRITATGVPHFMDFQYELWADRAPAQSYSLGDDPSELLTILERSGEDPKEPVESVGERVIALEPEPGDAQVFFAHEGAGTITRIDFALEAQQPLALEELWLEATFDGASQPQAAAPIGAWVGSAAGFAEVRALFFSLDPEGRGSIYWPMPFSSSVRLLLRHRGHAARGRIVLQVALDDRAPAAGSGHLHAAHAEQLSVGGRDVVIYQRSGRGKVVGVQLVGYTNLPGLTRGWLEGDERIYIDGSRSPQIHGTGTEEFFGWGWYDAPVERRFSLPQHGSPYRLFDGVQDITAQYRVLFPDVIHFESEIRLGLECGPRNFVQTAGVRYVSTVFAYVLDEPGLVLSDTFDPATRSDLISHAYQANGSQSEVELQSGYEGDERANELFSDRGLSLSSGFLEFDVALDVRNRGALLRRRLDQTEREGETARVYVDGQYAGVWRAALNNQTWRWLDADFDLPAHLTRSKSRVRVRLEPLHFPWSEYHYQVYSRLR
ncbi:MAG: DUF2961 domain-containing protein [Planctomycetes bacterium]|nr:DUF2961 domain-containing protein [Planctomycetota bacterium]